jgi:hypothetical protein
MGKAASLLAVAAGMSLLSLQSAAAQETPRIHELGGVVAISDTFGSIVAVRHLSDGRVLVNDVAFRRVLLLDSTLSLLRVVADSTIATGRAFSGPVAGLIACRADSTLLVDPLSYSILIIDPLGRVVRTVAVPRAADAMSLANVTFGVAACDAAGRIIYRGAAVKRRANPSTPKAVIQSVDAAADSAPILRIDRLTRLVDTLSFVRIAAPRVHASRNNQGYTSVVVVVNPFPIVDDWAVRADGSLAVVRGVDYHVDFVNADGSHTSAANLPFRWRALSDDDKVALLDSMNAARGRLERADKNPDTITRAEPRVSGAERRGDGGRTSVFTTPRAGQTREVAEGSHADAQRAEVSFVTPSELPDYVPAFFAGAVHADEEDNVWIRTTATSQRNPGAVYDVVNNQGVLIDRVQLPAGRAIVGFGPPGVVYLEARHGSTVRLERVRMR